MYGTVQQVYGVYNRCKGLYSRCTAVYGRCIMDGVRQVWPYGLIYIKVPVRYRTGPSTSIYIIRYRKVPYREGLLMIYI